MVVVAWPLLTGSGQEKNASISERTQSYTTAKNLLVNGADALERIMSSYKEVSCFFPHCNVHHLLLAITIEFTKVLIEHCQL